MVAKYIYEKEVCGLKPKHKYELTFSKKAKSYVYDCNVTRDLTENKGMGLLIHFASELSIKQHFEIDNLIMED